MRSFELDALARIRQVAGAEAGPVGAWHADNLFSHQRRYRLDLELVRRWMPDGALLDVGCAPAHMTALLSLTGRDVVGVDLAPERVAGFIDRFGLDVRRCDIEREPLPFADVSFSGALLCETFEHLRVDPVFVLAEIQRVLAPGARLLLTTPNVYSLPSLGRFLLGRSVADPWAEFGKLRSLGHMGHVREYSMREVRRFLEASGWTLEWSGTRYSGRIEGPRRRILSTAFAVLPSWLGRELVLVARRGHQAPRLQPLVPR